MANKAWYHEGLRFNCTQCGDCCTGAPGFVWVNKEEIAALAAAIGEKDVEHFEDQYIRRSGIRKNLREFPNGDCVFFDGESRRCTVYAARHEIPLVIWPEALITISAKLSSCPKW